MERYSRNRIYISEEEQEKIKQVRILLGEPESAALSQNVPCGSDLRISPLWMGIKWRKVI